MAESRGYNVACCFWGALVLAVVLGLLFWPMLRDRLEGEQQHFEQLNELAD